MSQQQAPFRSRGYQIILYLCGLLLFLEWLYPIEQVTDTDNISIFIVYTLLCFIISFLQLTWWVSFLLKGFGMAFILNEIYLDMPFLSFGWYQAFLHEITVNIDILLSQNWYYLSPLFRSFLFLLLIWLMSYLLYYWFIQMKRILLFIIITIIYITVLDTFTNYDATLSIVRTMVLSLGALSITNLSRELERENISLDNSKQKVGWGLSLIAFILFSVLVGIAGPKTAPQWPDPVPFFAGGAEQTAGSGEEGIKKVGYGEDDSQLGGSFIQDNTPVFQVEANQEHYWRMETKDVYTGKGWENSKDPTYVEEEGELLGIDSFYFNVETEEQRARFEFLEGQNFDKLIYPYGMNGVVDASHEVDYFIDSMSESVETRLNGDGFELDYYEVQYSSPSFSLHTLQKNTQVTADLSTYLQLPDSLPRRVADLAEEITELEDTQYEKVRAIERYFGRNDFTYETVGVAVPGEGDDYVDQFLFDTQMGYCDNFSSAMVVMLRTLDIPARWVKGFTGGEVVEEVEGQDEAIYEVTNSNAHSWVEVYFPAVGWVPFEPTQGFSNLTDFHVDQNEASGDARGDTLDVENQEQPGVDLGVGEDEAASAMAEPSDPQYNETFQFWLITTITASMIVLALLAFILYKYRFRLQSAYTLVKWGSRKDEQAFQDAYHHLLAVLDHEGYERDKNQTLREYAKRMDARLETKEMQELTNYYERMLYRKEFDSSESNYLKKLWKQLLRTIRG